MERIYARLGRFGTTVLLLVIAMGLVWWGYSTWASGKTAKVEAKLNRNLSGAALESGADAVGAVGGVGAKAEQSDEIGRENADAIRKAPGAAAPVDPAVNDAGLRGLCRRAVNRERPECVQFVTPAGVAQGRGGG